MHSSGKETWEIERFYVINQCCWYFHWVTCYWWVTELGDRIRTADGGWDASGRQCKFQSVLGVLLCWRKLYCLSPSVWYVHISTTCHQWRRLLDVLLVCMLGHCRVEGTYHLMKDIQKVMPPWRYLMQCCEFEAELIPTCLLFLELQFVLGYGLLDKKFCIVFDLKWMTLVLKYINQWAVIEF